MTKRDRHISQTEIDRQSEIIQKLKTKNDGKNPLAYVLTLGCAQNENDSERIRGILTEIGYTMCDDEKIADIVIFNTCAVRENAELKVYGYIGALKNIKAVRPDMLIGVCGCMMQQSHIVEHIKNSYRHVDMVFGTHTIHHLPQIIYSSMKQRVVDIEDTDGYIVENVPHLRTSSIVASVAIMYGCNNFCTYCVVPYVRGRERSRASSDIIAEIQGLAAQGCKEVTLLGQNVNSYGRDCDEVDFADLLNLISEINGIERIRFVSSHPKDITDKLISVIASNKKVCNQLHLPFQAGSNKVLNDMNRKYTKEQYLDIIKKVKLAVPNIAITSDIIVGFPSETVSDFEHTIDVIKQIEFEMLYTFIYSKRKGTPAEKMEFLLSEEEIKKNFDRLLTIQNEISNKKNKELVNTVQIVLVEGFSKTNKDALSGRTEFGKIVNFPGDKELIGQFVNVKITLAATWSLTGELI